MAEKEKKKKKKKGKGKGKKKNALSNFERETFLLAIEGLENKIKWRRELCNLINNDIKYQEQAYEEERKNKVNMIHCLEKTIQDQLRMQEEFKIAIPENEKHRTQAKESRLRELGVAITESNKEKMSYSSKLDALKQTLHVLEVYDEDKINKRIVQIESEINTFNEDELLKEADTNKRRENSFQFEVSEIFDEKIAEYQKAMKESIDSVNLKIAEETRWYEYSGNILRRKRAHLEREKEERKGNLIKGKESIRNRKEEALKLSLELRDQKKKILGLEKHNAELLNTIENESLLREEHKQLLSSTESANDSLKTLKKILDQSVKLLEHNETHLKALEDELEETKMFGQYLAEQKEKAQKIIKEELEYPLIKRYNGPPVKKNMIEELVFLLNNTAKNIYEQIKN